MRAAALLVAALAVACNGRSRSPALDRSDDTEDKDSKGGPAGAGSGEIAVFDLSDGVHESASAGFLVPLAASRTYVGLVLAVERMARSPETRGVFISLGDANLDWAKSEELGGAFSRFRENTKKPVVCHANSLENSTVWLAARACSRIWVSPAGEVSTVGIAGQVVYLKGALDKLKVRADFLHMGKYKSAAESLTQEGPSPEARESLTAVFSSMRRTWIDGTAEGRKGANVTEALEDGPFSPELAKQRGIVDEVGYEDEARKDAEKLAGTGRTTSAFGGKTKHDSGFDVTEILRVLSGAEGGGTKPHIAVIPAAGSIAMASSGPFSDDGITAAAMKKTIRKVAADDAVKAVVLRIDSPGGSALASDLLWHELMELKKKKPLIASVGSMAASGGYYLACAANKVVAPRTSIVGSIGVLGGKIVFNEALAEYGVHAETFPASDREGAAARAAYLSPLSSWDEPTRERVRVQMESVYELFLRRVSEGRGMPVPLVRAVAEGRIWSGVQGHKLRLVDELGGLGKALELARSLGKLDADAPVRVEGVGETLLESLLLGDEAEEAAIRAAVARAEARDQRFDEIAPGVRPFVRALGPLAAGETTLAALPFALDVR